MSLSSGRFTILGFGGSNTTRNHREDRSNGPKGVFSPADTNEPGDWEVEKLDNGRYILRCRKAPTGVKNNLLYAFLDEHNKPEEWVITRRQPTGLYSYVGSPPDSKVSSSDIC